MGNLREALETRLEVDMASMERRGLKEIRNPNDE
jgi:hypothetical protein